MSEQFDYYYGTQAEQFCFYRIPKALFTDSRFSGLSCESKVLYGLLLDRMGLSIKNNWVDENNQVFIYFTLKDIMQFMNCSHEKGGKLMAELDSIKGIGLIERKKQGLGKPDMIYVKKFITNADTIVPVADVTDSVCTKEESSELQTSENRNAGSLGFRFSETNNTELNNTKFNNTNQSIKSSSFAEQQVEVKQDKTDRLEAIATYKEIIDENISCDVLAQQYGPDKAASISELILETVCSTKDFFIISGESFPAELVKSRFLKLNIMHVQYVLDSLQKNTTKVHNIKKYLLTALYNAPVTITHYYQAEVNHDLYGIDKLSPNN